MTRRIFSTFVYWTMGISSLSAVFWLVGFVSIAHDVPFFIKCLSILAFLSIVVSNSVILFLLFVETIDRATRDTEKDEYIINKNLSRISKLSVHEEYVE